MACGTVFFVGVAGLAVGLSIFVDRLEEWHQPPFIIAVFRAIEILMLLGDSVLFIFYLVVEFHKMFVELRETR